MLKENDFISVSFTGTLETGEVFDTTSKKVAQENNIYNDKAEYGPLIICLGQGQMLKGLEERLVGKEPGEFTFNLSPDEAFGKKNAKLVVMIPASKFKDQKIKPIPGLQINMDGSLGTVKMVSGGRVIVDFNHPLAGKNLNYNIKVERVLEDEKEKVESVFKFVFGLKEITITKEKDSYEVEMKTQMPEELQKLMVDKIKELTGAKIHFKENKPLNKEEKKSKKNDGSK